MRILIAWISQFLGRNGGMEKVSIRFANEMVRRGHSVDLAYCTERDGKVYTPIDPCVGVVNIAHYLPGGKWESHKTTSFKIKREVWQSIPFIRTMRVFLETKINSCICADGNVMLSYLR